MDVLFLLRMLRLFPALKSSIEHSSARKVFLGASFCWDSRLSLREMDQKFKIGSTIGYGYSYLEIVFSHFKVLSLHAILHDAAWALWVDSGKGPSYCYKIGRGPNSCLLDNVTGQLFWFYVKFFLPSILKFVDTWSGMFCIVLGIELAHIKLFEELGAFIDSKVQGHSFCPPKMYKPTNEAFCILVYREYAQNCVEQRKFRL